MSLLPKSARRAAQARINGAKSHGPKTPEGLNTARTASLQHGLYAAEPTLESITDPAQYAELRAEYMAVWNPVNRYIADKVDDLVAFRWELNRLRIVRRDYYAQIYASISSHGVAKATAMEMEASGKGSIMERFEVRIRRCTLAIARIERDIIQLTRHFENSGASHNILETNDDAAEVPAPPPAKSHCQPPGEENTGYLAPNLGKTPAFDPPN